MSNLDYKPPEPTKAQLEYARYLSRFQAPRGRRLAANAVTAGKVAVSKRRVDAGLFSPAPNRISRPLSGKRRRTVPGTPAISPPGPASIPGPPMICSSGAKLRLKRCSPQPMRWE